MGIDIYASWTGKSDEELKAQHEAKFDVTMGRTGYLREAYHGEPYATQYLFAEVFEGENGARIPAAILKARLPRTLALAEERERTLYRANEKLIEEVKQSYRDFVALCEQKEKEHGEPVQIIASY
jgi:hypothetical protein